MSATKIIGLAKSLHDQMRVDAPGALAKIPEALQEIARVKGQTKRNDVVDLANSTQVYLQSMVTHGKYESAFGATLSLLENRASGAIEIEAAIENESMRAELARLKAAQPAA